MAGASGGETRPTPNAASATPRATSESSENNITQRFALVQRLLRSPASVFRALHRWRRCGLPKRGVGRQARLVPPRPPAPSLCLLLALPAQVLAEPVATSQPRTRPESRVLQAAHHLLVSHVPPWLLLSFRASCLCGLRGEQIFFELNGLWRGLDMRTLDNGMRTLSRALPARVTLCLALIAYLSSRLFLPQVPLAKTHFGRLTRA